MATGASPGIAGWVSMADLGHTRGSWLPLPPDVDLDQGRGEMTFARGDRACVLLQVYPTIMVEDFANDAPVSAACHGLELLIGKLIALCLGKGDHLFGRLAGLCLGLLPGCQVLEFHRLAFRLCPTCVHTSPSCRQGLSDSLAIRDRLDRSNPSGADVLAGIRGYGSVHGVHPP